MLEANAFFSKNLLRPNLLRSCILTEAEKWVAISEDEVGVANHPHFMNSRLSASQTRLIIPDDIRIACELKESESSEKKAKRKAPKKRKVDMEREKRKR